MTRLTADMGKLCRGTGSPKWNTCSSKPAEGSSEGTFLGFGCYGAYFSSLALLAEFHSDIYD